MGAGRNAIGDEAVTWALDDVAFEPDRRPGHVRDQRLRLGGVPVDLESAVTGDACDRGGEGVRRLRVEQDDAAQVAVP